MKAHIQFITSTNAYEDSPILELEVSKRAHLLELIASHKAESPDPAKAMISFIILANSYLGTKALSIHEESRGNFNNVIEIHARVPNVVEFVYKKDDGKTDWRKVDIFEEDKHYVKGHDVNDNNSFKSFRKTNIVGGKMIKV